tara:strand:- start:21 stop:287 length:267 start_codon:yes stop_codon:yes gene_type:complete
MAVGDVVNGLSTTADLIIQPAATVELCITSYGSMVTNSYLTNGVIQAYLRAGIGVLDQIINKLLITNTNYLKILVDGNGCHYTGVQIK